MNDKLLTSSIGRPSDHNTSSSEDKPSSLLLETQDKSANAHAGKMTRHAQSTAHLNDIELVDSRRAEVKPDIMITRVGEIPHIERLPYISKVGETPQLFPYISTDPVRMPLIRGTDIDPGFSLPAGGPTGKDIDPGWAPPYPRVTDYPLWGPQHPDTNDPTWAPSPEEEGRRVKRLMEAPPEPQHAPAKAPEDGLSSFIHKVGAVVGDIVSGVKDEIVHHPGELLKDAVVGGALAVGATFLAPEIAIGAAVVGIGAGVVGVAQNAGKWMHAADVVANEDQYTASEREAAHRELHGIGEQAAELGAGLIGGGAGSLGLKLARGAASAEIAAASSAEAAAAREGAAEGIGSPRGGAEIGKTPEVSQGPKSEPLAPRELAKELGVKIDSSEWDCVYRVGDREYKLLGRPRSWFYGKEPRLEDVGALKVHVGVSGPEDLARLQKVLIPWLSDNAEAKELLLGWKTFNPIKGFLSYPIDDLFPNGIGQGAKGFTIFTRTAEDAIKLQELIDRELVNNNLSLKAPIKSGNVDVITGGSNRVGLSRDFFPVTEEPLGNAPLWKERSVGARFDTELAQRMEQKYGGGGHLNDAQLRAMEHDAGVKSGSIRYDKDGKLMLKLERLDVPDNGRMYVNEADAVKTPGQLTDRPAMYAVARLFGWDLANGARL